MAKWMQSGRESRDLGASVAPPRMAAGAGKSGLTSAEAAVRLRRDGPNVFPRGPGVSAWRHVFAQMVHFFALMLWAAGGLAIVAGMPQLGVAIFVVIVVNGTFAFAQEYRAEHATERLGTLLPRRATVLRDGAPCTVDAAEIVVDDVVILSSGDRVSADASVLEASVLELDTSILTGESDPASVTPGDAVLAGMLVLSGEGLASVTATGDRTRLASIARLTRGARRPRPPLARELDRVVRRVALIAMGVGVAFFLTAVALGSSLSDGFLLAIGVTVALVPEGLLPTVTLSLAVGAQRMAGQQALVRRLDAVETLGATTFICTDKTGTLTRNEMVVVAVWTPAGGATVSGAGYDPVGTVAPERGARGAVERLAIAASRCSGGRVVLRNGLWVAEGDPLEAAVSVFASRAGLDVEANERDDPEVRRFPFDPKRRRMSVVTERAVYVKGAPEAVVPLCAPIKGSEDRVRELAGRGLRVIAVASGSAVEASDAEGAEQGLELLGFLGLEDPPRAGVSDAIAACRRLGIKVAMVTGDHPITAAAIGREIGLSRPTDLVLEGKDLPADLEALGALLDRDGTVISRVVPEDKLRLAQALQLRGHIVAMTGDGVNDGPALREADVGVAMGRAGTDVAREAADVVLLDDNFATIVRAIEQGRTMFANIRRFLTYHLTDNVAELTPFVIWALSGGEFPLALGVLQILCLDIGTDLLPALALGAERPHPHELQEAQRGQRLIDRVVLQRAFGVLGPAEAVVEMLAFAAAMAAAGWRPGGSFPEGTGLLAASGAAFSAVVIGQVANAFACRSSRLSPGSLGWFTNRFLLVAVLAELVLLAGFLFISPLADLLDQGPPPLLGFAVAALAFPAVLAADASWKWVVRRRTHPAR